jgi:hypothetical protein
MNCRQLVETIPATPRAPRCANDGQCLLVDYKDSTGSTGARDHLSGHAAYTRLHAMLFNTTEICLACYTVEDHE